MTPARPILLLASTSPRRRDLLLAAGIGFEVCTPGPEPEGQGTPIELAAQRARLKARHAEVPASSDLPVLGVDTVVDVDGVELGKAPDAGTAARWLQRLVGRVHRVHTAHCLWSPAAGQMFEEVATAEVRGGAPSQGEIDAYLRSGDWRGKAGAYGIQDPGLRFLQLHAGAFDTVVGLHVAAVRRLLVRCGK